MKRTRALPVTVVALLALVLGSLGAAGTAYAAGLTVKQVKTIAGQVVKAKAPRLKVKRAKVANLAKDSQKVGGLSAEQLQTTGYTYNLPTQATSFSRTYAFPGLPAGTYLASYAYTADMTVATASIGCGFDDPTASPLRVPSYSVPAGSGFARGSASAIITVDATTILTCSISTGTWSINSFNDNTVSFIPVDTQVDGTPTAARPVPERPAAG